MRGNPFTEFMSKEVEQWEDILMRTSDNLEMWLNVQAVWMALEPVFTSEDIIRQMAKEGNLFNQVNKAWEKLMKRTTDTPQALTVVAYDDLGDILKEAQKKLDLV
jgi:dynein heavy chain